MRTIPIKTNDKLFYRQFLNLFHSIPPFSRLRPRELDVLAEIMYHNNELKELSEDKRAILVFHTDNRRVMQETLGVSEDTFNNNLSALRKHNVLGKNNRLTPFLEKILFNGEFSLTFKFTSDE